MEKQLAWIHSPPRAQVSFRWSTRRSTVRSAAGCGMGRGSRGSTQGYIRENKADRANKLLLSYVKMGLSEQAHLQRRKMEDRGLPVSQESEDALRKIPAAHDWRSRTPVEVADIAASHSREQLDLNADRKHWKAQGNMHVTILNERDLAAAKDEQVKADMAELHTTVTGLDMFSVSLLFRGKAVQIYLDAGTPFRVVRTAVQASFGLHPEQQLLYLRKACNVVAPPKETRPEKAPSLSITRLAKIKALARNAAERARNNARTKEIDGETHPQEWMLSVGLSQVLGHGRVKVGPIHGRWPRPRTPVVSPPSLSPPASPDGSAGPASLLLSASMRQHRLRRSLGHPTAMPSVLSGEKAAERSRLDPYEEWRRQRDPTYLATPLPVAATKNRSVGVLGIQVGDAITIGVDREATKRIQRNAIKRELGDPRFFEQRTEKAFNKFDVDGGGTIEADELQMTMDSLGLRLSDEEVAALVEKYDVDGDAQFDLEEFRTMVRDMIRDDTPEPGDEPREPVSLPTSP